MRARRQDKKEREKDGRKKAAPLFSPLARATKSLFGFGVTNDRRCNLSPRIKRARASRIRLARAPRLICFSTRLERVRRRLARSYLATAKSGVSSSSSGAPPDWHPSAPHSSFTATGMEENRLVRAEASECTWPHSFHIMRTWWRERENKNKNVWHHMNNMRSRVKEITWE